MDTIGQTENQSLTNMYLAVALATIVLAFLGDVEAFQSLLPSSSRRSSVGRSATLQARELAVGIQDGTMQKRSVSCQIQLGNNDDNETPISVLDSIGWACQPVVWLSLYSVATTGAGLPEGPGGSIGAVEGLSYLLVLVLTVVPTGTSATKIVSRFTIGLGLVVLAGLAAQRGCVPNAQPILDYSDYLPVCKSEP